MLYKNVASQKIAVFAYTASTGAAKTGDAAQITAYISKDFAAGAATNDVNPTEMDATNMPGWYVFDLTQAETNAEVIVLAPKSSTSGVVLDQAQVFTQDAAISSRASQTSVDDVPTVVEFEARTLVAADYVVVSDLPSVPTASDNATAAAVAILAAADSDPISANVTYSAGVAVSGRLAEVTDLPSEPLDATATQAAAAAALTAYDPPTNAEMEARTLVAASYATAAALDAVDNYVDTEIAAIKAKTDNLPSDPADQSAVEAAITAATSTLATAANLATLAGYVDTEVAAILAAVDTEVAAIKAKTDNLPASPAAVGSAMTLTEAYDAAKTAATQTSVYDLPTNAELAAALAAADDAMLAAIADVPTVAEFEARTLPAADYTVVSDLPSVASVADAVWDEAIAGHAVAGSTGAALSAAGAAGDPWSTALPGAYGAGTAGKLLSDIEAVAPDNKPTVAATGEATANVTHWAGVAVAAADANGNVPVVLYPTQGAVTFGQVKILADVANQGALQVVNSNAYGQGQYIEGGFAGQHNNGGYAGQYNQGGNRGQYNAGPTPVVGAAQQEIADALKLAPAAGTPATGSVYDLLGDAALEATAQAILEDTGTTLPTAIAAIEPGGGSYAGDGIGYYSDTIDDGTSPLDGVRVQLYTSPNRVGPAYEAYTNALGVFEMWPDPGTYYRWLDLAGYNFSQDVAVTVTEP